MTIPAAPLDLSTPIESIGLPVRALNCLRGEGIYQIGQLLAFTETELLKTPNLGRRSLDDVKRVLSEHGLHLSRVPWGRNDHPAPETFEVVWLLREIRDELRLMREALEAKR